SAPRVAPGRGRSRPPWPAAAVVCPCSDGAHGDDRRSGRGHDGRDAGHHLISRRRERGCDPIGNEPSRLRRGLAAPGGCAPHPLRRPKEAMPRNITIPLPALPEAAGPKAQHITALGMGRKIIIGNKNYSSWSLRPWIAMKVAGIDFDEEVISLDANDFKSRVTKISGTGKVPALADGKVQVWESLAILEYLAEKYPDARLWPA